MSDSRNVLSFSSFQEKIACETCMSQEDEDTSFAVRCSNGQYIDLEPDTSSKESLALKAEPLKVPKSQLPDKDILVGMETNVKAHKLRILPHGINHKGNFEPFIDQKKIYALQNVVSPSFEGLKDVQLKCCANSHD
ncbi:hypothetical protein FNV43_RR17065 [Rhamnella rubrinervis]|uniref:Uncharacterized protein n=1 Tax=Rhamnella rubrinervis TaxID=2594499 RepID=A0A8K0GZX9_9ROSA|nr:hypothetical protein FNV43_RR17065 [Rhamnella rubrinervis]